jgi:hypothetical protein
MGLLAIWAWMSLNGHQARVRGHVAGSPRAWMYLNRREVTVRGYVAGW